MSKITSMMDIGRRSMMNSQTALQTVGHNIANKDTEGYSRQRVELKSNIPIGSGKLRYGTGSRTDAVTRTNNPHLEKQIGAERSKMGFYGGKQDALVRVEQVYNEQINKGLNSFITEFFNAFRELSNNPESLASRTQVREIADFLTRDFNRIHTQLTQIQNDIDNQLKIQVHEVNEMSREIASLNQKIQSVELSGGHANDERDRRDLLIKKMGELVNIRWAEGENGSVTITAGNNALLVTGFDSKTLDVVSTPASKGKREGSVDIIYLNTPSSNPVYVTKQMNGGSIGGLLEVRDQTIIDLVGRLDEMAYAVGTRVNALHSQGYNAYNEKGQEFFERLIGLENAAQNLRISRDLSDDVARIATAAQPDSPGDNRIANELANLQYEKIMGNGGATLNEFYSTTVGQVGVYMNRAESALESQSSIVHQLENIRESISGVSIDEEATKLIEFQKAFDASARLIRTADEMFDTVLNLKRM